MYDEVSIWLNNALRQEIPEETAAFCLNLYDDGDGNWSMELIGSGKFDVEDDDWPCDEITDFNTREMPFTWNQPGRWERVLKEMISIIEEYLKHGEYADILKSRSGVGIGFVDGDIENLYIK